MKLAIMQPYLFPYIGYWQLIASADKFIFFDVVQYNKRSWMNRNRVLHFEESKGFQYITVPVKKHERGTLVKDVLINKEQDYKEKILGNLTVYKKNSAPFYQEIVNLVNEILNSGADSLLDLSIYSTAKILNYLSIDFNYNIASRIDFDREAIKKPGDWALSICKELGASSYINPHGGCDIFDEEKYINNGVILNFVKPKLTPYNQGLNQGFLEGLSIIDVLMFNRPEKVRDIILNDFDIKKKEDLLTTNGL